MRQHRRSAMMIGRLHFSLVVLVVAVLSGCAAKEEANQNTDRRESDWQQTKQRFENGKDRPGVADESAAQNQPFELRGARRGERDRSGAGERFAQNDKWTFCRECAARNCFKLRIVKRLRGGVTHYLHVELCAQCSNESIKQGSGTVQTGEQD